MINDDRFIMGSMDHWEFGLDNTGNLLVKTNIEQDLVRGRPGDPGRPLSGDNPGGWRGPVLIPADDPGQD